MYKTIKSQSTGPPSQVVPPVDLSPSQLVPDQSIGSPSQLFPLVNWSLQSTDPPSQLVPLAN